jgi:predicted transcriptional regulator
VGKPATTRFTFDLDESMQKKLTALAENTNGSKASVLKFLINEVYKELTD